MSKSKTETVPLCAECFAEGVDPRAEIVSCAHGQWIVSNGEVVDGSASEAPAPTPDDTAAAEPAPSDDAATQA